MAAGGRPDGIGAEEGLIAGSDRPPHPTIFALSSGAPPAAISIVRVSGPLAGKAAIGLAGPLPVPRMATLRRFVEDGEVIDRGLLLWFPASGSVTGEDLAEFHLHGGRAVVARLLDALGRRRGLVPAAPGEFSRRAALNGRLGLNEAEALADLLEAETEAERRAAFTVFDGAFGMRIETWRQAVLDIAASIEASIDHDEETGSGEADIRAALHALAGTITAAAHGVSREELRAGATIVLLGPPNSGKSSLLNALSGREAALVTPVPGTTRDIVEVALTIGGQRVRLLDTAGLRETNDEVEALGISRARSAAVAADARIWLGDEEAPPAGDAPLLSVWARCDDPERNRAVDRLRVSSVTGEGLDALTSWMQGVTRRTIGELVMTRRQMELTRALSDDLRLAAEEADMLLVSEHVRHARMSLDALHGRAGVEHMYDALFKRFCLGK